MRFRAALICLSAACVTAVVLGDGPADNIPTDVRRVPKIGITLRPEQADELTTGLSELRGLIDRVRKEKAKAADLLPDLEIFHKAVHDALTYQEFFTEPEVEKAKGLLQLGRVRAHAWLSGEPRWTRDHGLVVRGYRSRIDGSYQPYGLVIPNTPPPAGGYRLDLWFHGRGEVLSEVNFIDERRKRAGEFSPADTIVLHPYGRYCNANKFAGEIDALEALESVQSRYPINPDKIAVRGFSMGGASTWQFAVHYADRWFAANPGAGFSETPRFLNVFQKEKLTPSWYEQTLWNLYDCDKWCENLAQCPTVAYSGEIDSQKQAADVMAEALAKENIQLVHVIGPKTKHAYHPEAKKEVERRLASLAEKGRDRFPAEVRFTTYTLRYNRMNWVTIDGLAEHWKRGRVHANLTAGNAIEATTENVTALTLDFPPGHAPFSLGSSIKVVLDGQTVPAPPTFSDRSWSARYVRSNGTWSAGTLPAETVLKRHELQGPIDDAFMDSFVFVRPTKKSPRAAFQAWSEAEMTRAIEHWRRHFRGEAQVRDDNRVSDAEIASSNLVLWGDPESNAVLARIADKLPIAWTSEAIRVGSQSYASDQHALILIAPNPLNPRKYVVLNSGFTFRDYDYLNNARQVPRLPDWAVVDLNTAPDARYPGKIVAADFFDETWKLRPERKQP